MALRIALDSSQLIERRKSATHEVFYLALGETMRKNVFGRSALVMVLAMALSSCQNAKTREENEQLKAHVLQLQKDSGELGNRVEVLTNENAKLKLQVEQLKKKPTAKKTAKPTTHQKTSRPRNSRQN